MLKYKLFQSKSGILCLRKLEPENWIYLLNRLLLWLFPGRWHCAGRIFWLYLRSEGVVCFVHTVKLLSPRGPRRPRGTPGISSWNNIESPYSSVLSPHQNPSSYSGVLNDVSSRITLLILQIFYKNIFINIHPADTSLSTFSQQYCCVSTCPHTGQLYKL